MQHAGASGQFDLELRPIALSSPAIAQTRAAPCRQLAIRRLATARYALARHNAFRFDQCWLSGGFGGARGHGKAIVARQNQQQNAEVIHRR